MGLGWRVEGAVGRGDTKGAEGQMNGGFQFVEAGDGLLRPLRHFVEAGGVGPAVAAPPPGFGEALSQESSCWMSE